MEETIRINQVEFEPHFDDSGAVNCYTVRLINKQNLIDKVRLGIIDNFPPWIFMTDTSDLKPVFLDYDSVAAIAEFLYMLKRKEEKE